MNNDKPTNDSYPLYLFAKSPVAGEVKTRMQPQLNCEQSAQLAEQLIVDAVSTCVTHWHGEVVLTVTPDTHHPLFTELARQYKQLRLELQVTGNLGTRLYHSLNQGIDHTGAAVVMGCDIPSVDSTILQQVWDAIHHDTNIIGATTDGGFYILGMATYHSQMFQKIEWGTDRVFDQLTDNFSQLHIALQSCPSLRDIDNWDDLQWLATNQASYYHYLKKP